MTPSRLMRGALLAALTLVSLAPAFAQQTFVTTVWFDYKYFMTTEGPVTFKPTSPNGAYLSNAFLFRRAYFTYDSRINDNLRFRFRLDADNTRNVTGVTLTGSPVSGVSTSTDGKLRPYMKHLYLQYDNFLVPKMTLHVGMIETLTFKPAEDRWGYRSVAKTLLDGYRDITKRSIEVSSADIGATLKYSLSKFFRLAAGIYNGAQYTREENDQFKEIQVQAQITPIPGFSIVGYLDYEQKLPVASLPLETRPTQAIYKIDAFFEMVQNLVVGGEWFVFKNDLFQTAGVKYDVSGWSVFGRYTVTPDKLAVFGRYDSYMPNSDDRDQDMSLVIAGLDWTPFHASWKLQPNIWFYNYKDGTRYLATATKDTDIVINLTFALSF